MTKGNFSEAERIFFQLGNFRDSRDKAQLAYVEALSAKYNRAEEMIRNEDYNQAEQMYISLGDYLDSKAKARTAHLAHEDWKASLLSMQKETEGKQGNRNWVCSVCGKENVYFVYKCSCGATR